MQSITQFRQIFDLVRSCSKPAILYVISVTSSQRNKKNPKYTRAKTQNLHKTDRIILHGSLMGQVMQCVHLYWSYVSTAQPTNYIVLTRPAAMQYAPMTACTASLCVALLFTLFANKFVLHCPRHPPQSSAAKFIPQFASGHTALQPLIS